MAQISKWKWRVGFWLAILFGVLNAVAGGLTGTWKTFVVVLCTSILTQLTSYLTKSPLDDVDETLLPPAPTTGPGINQPKPPTPNTP